MTQTAGLETVAGTVMGTFAYMSPEQVRGRAVDFRSDLFSLGVVLYEMLTARLPFEGSTITEVIDGVINHEPPALARFNYNIPPELERVVLKLLAKDPDYRYQSARELYIDLSAIGRGLDHPSHPHSHVQPAPAGFSPAWRGCRTRCRIAGPVRAHPARSKRCSGRRRLPGRSVEWEQSESARSLALARANSGPRGVVVPQVLAPERPQLDRAVAVMTFANITRDADDEWIGSGIAETVTSDLKNVRGINVIGRTQVFDALKHLSTADLQRVNDQVIDIGRRLGATWIVGGAYQRLGPQIRITAEFVDVRSGTPAEDGEGRRQGRRPLQPAGQDRLRTEPGPECQPAAVGDPGDRAGRNRIDRGLRSVFARHDEPADGHAGIDGSRDRAVRTGARHRSALRLGVGAARRHVQPEGPVPDAARADRAGPSNCSNTRSRSTRIMPPRMPGSAAPISRRDASRMRSAC